MWVAWIRHQRASDRGAPRADARPAAGRDQARQSLDLAHLLGDVDVDRRLRVDPVQHGERLEQRLVRHGAQRMRREAEAEVGIARDRGTQPLQERAEGVRSLTKPALARIGRRAAEAARAYRAPAAG